MSKYRRCPHCNNKVLKETVICPKCNRLLDSQITTNEPKIDYGEEKSSNKFIILVLLIITLLIIGGIYYYKKPLPTTQNNNQDNFVAKPFLESINIIKYNSSYIENKLIPVKDYSSEKPFKLIDKNGQVIVKDIAKYIADYNSFHIIAKNVNNNVHYFIIDNNGETLYETKDNIKYYPNTDSWLIGNNLYNNKKLINENINIDNTKEYNGYYFSYVSDTEQGIIDYKGNVSYKSTPKKYNHFVLETNIINPHQNEHYCLLNDNYNYLIVNCKTGEIILDNQNKKIKEIAPNLFNINDKTLYINNLGEFVEFNPERKKDIYYEYLDNNQMIIDTAAYDNNTNEKQDINSIELRSLNNKNIENKLNVQKTYCLNINTLNFGLKYNNEEIIPCNSSDIIYFDTSIMEYIASYNKLYLIINSNKEYYLFDVKNNKILINNITQATPSSIFIEYKDNNKKLIYNIIADETIEVPVNTLIELHNNYFVVEKFSNNKSSTNREYYNYEFKNIYLGE